ncbi:hypothetical protein [Pseudotamlana carrageenivorans]|uniref:DUF4398 domain-containing protein n=1 Tax=Pseudotamlana carrageenivorans TaxID=2069432 RepID=A0A2I7SMH0_9FLAO|nr:hypothetical protein [Tamlana carrageenivorans]AUS07096.1 hypothetical protein C1A40_17370 [Tamlana carrageenivorans]
MKNYYLLFFLTASMVVSAQTNCDNANSYLGNAYSHVKDSYESNNISHLKHYANRSVESFKLAKEALSFCNCEKAVELAEKSIDLLVKVESAETYEDGRFFVKRGRELSKESLIEIDKCAYNQYQKVAPTTTTVAVSNTTSSTELSDLQQEQLKLKQQQEALKLKAEQIKMQLAQQEAQELALRKQQIIKSYKARILENVKSFNETLKVYGSNSPITFEETVIDLETKSVTEIKSHYINEMKTITKNYLEALNQCEAS